METQYYLDEFIRITGNLDQQLFRQHQLELKAGTWLQSVALKIQKRSWLNQSQKARAFEESIFFSVWISDRAIREGKLLYNIHALKLRELTAYSIQSREFAAAFRAKFKPFEKKWPNVSTNFGPLTLMEGWVCVDVKNFGKDLADLAYQFLEIQSIIDDLLTERKK
jgi:hypothetical protein